MKGEGVKNKHENCFHGCHREKILKLFSEHDDFMIDFLGEDQVYYTRYSEKEMIEKVWAAFSDDLPIGCIAYRTKAEGTGEVKRLFLKKTIGAREFQRSC